MNDLITKMSSDAFIIEKRDHALALAESLAPPEDKDSVERALGVRNELLNTITAIESFRKDLTAPLDEMKKALIAKERELSAKCAEYAADIEAAVGQYRARIDAENARREAIARREAEEIRKTEAANGVETRATPALVVHQPVLDTAKIPTRRVARLVVSDEVVLHENWPEFFALNETKLKAYLAAGNAVDGAHLEWDEKIMKGRG